MNARLRLPLLALLAALLLAATAAVGCGDDEEEPAQTQVTTVTRTETELTDIKVHGDVAEAVSPRARPDPQAGADLHEGRRPVEDRPSVGPGVVSAGSFSASRRGAAP